MQLIMANAFEEASAVERIDNDTFRARIPDSWQQGRGAFGGLVLGTLLRAMQRYEPDPARSVRALTSDLCGAVLPGDAKIHVSLLRRGARVTYLDAQLRQQAQVMARASAVLACSRDDVVAPALPAPVAPAPPPWQSVAPVPVQPPLRIQWNAHPEQEYACSVRCSQAVRSRHAHDQLPSIGRQGEHSMVTQGHGTPPRVHSGRHLHKEGPAPAQSACGE
jgi:acyl-CoA thioesterase